MSEFKFGDEVQVKASRLWFPAIYVGKESPDKIGAYVLMTGLVCYVPDDHYIRASTAKKLAENAHD